MPNIELHNFCIDSDKEGILGLLESLEKSKSLIDETKKKVWKALEGASYYDEVVVTRYFTFSEGPSGGQAKSYFRIFATDRSEVENIVERLDPLEIDMEIGGLLRDFIECRSTRLKRQEEAQAVLSTLRPVAGSDSEFDYEASRKAITDDGSDGPFERKGTGHIDEQ